VLTVRGRSFSQKGKGDHRRLKFRADFRDLKKNQCVFCKELGHWKIDCPRIKDKKKESKPEANLHRWPLQGGTSQTGRSDLDSSVFSFSITIPNIGYSGDSEWILDMDGTYHVCPNRDWFSSFEKLDGCSVVMGVDHPCNMKGICIVLITMFDGMIRELKEVSMYLNWHLSQTLLC